MWVASRDPAVLSRGQEGLDHAPLPSSANPMEGLPPPPAIPMGGLALQPLLAPMPAASSADSRRRAGVLIILHGNVRGRTLNETAHPGQEP